MVNKPYNGPYFSYRIDHIILAISYESYDIILYEMHDPLLCTLI